MRFKARWTLWMIVFGLLTAAIVYAVTGSVGWSIVGLLGSGIVLNAVAQPGRTR